MGKAGLALDAVILAAGRGQRMHGIARPFYKPLLELNGIPLIAYALDYAMAAHCKNIVIVASESNIFDIKSAVTPIFNDAIFTVQRVPNGPGDAALVGLSSVSAKRTMLLMSDNIMNRSTVAKMAKESEAFDRDSIGIRFVSAEQASRFTRVRLDCAGQYSYVEGGEVQPADIWPLRNDVAVWCGPIVFETDVAKTVLSQAEANGELKIGPYLDKIMSCSTEFYEVNALDIGIPSAYAEARVDSV